MRFVKDLGTISRKIAKVLRTGDNFIGKLRKFNVKQVSKSDARSTFCTFKNWGQFHGKLRMFKCSTDFRERECRLWSEFTEKIKSFKQVSLTLVQRLVRFCRAGDSFKENCESSSVWIDFTKVFQTTSWDVSSMIDFRFHMSDLTEKSVLERPECQSSQSRLLRV